MSNIERTLSIIKPDAVERNLIDEIKTIFVQSPDFVCVKVFNLGSLPLKLNYIVN